MLLEKIKQNLNESRAYNNSLYELKDHLHNVAYQEPHDDKLERGLTGRQEVEDSASEAARHMIRLHLANNPGAHEKIYKKHSSDELNEIVANHLKGLGQGKLMDVYYAADEHQAAEQQNEPKKDRIARRFRELIAHHLNAALRSKK
jgi:hypothetical protein